MEFTEKNRLFISQFIETKRPFKDFPDRVSEDMTIHEPALLPFGGSYKGAKAQEKLFPKIGEFYDFSKFNLISVSADGNAVFAIMKIGLLNSVSEIMICEKFSFEDDKLTEVRVFVYDSPDAPLLIRHNEE